MDKKLDRITVVKEIDFSGKASCRFCEKTPAGKNRPDGEELKMVRICISDPAEAWTEKNVQKSKNDLGKYDGFSGLKGRL